LEKQRKDHDRRKDVRQHRDEQVVAEQRPVGAGDDAGIEARRIMRRGSDVAHLNSLEWTAAIILIRSLPPSKRARRCAPGASSLTWAVTPAPIGAHSARSHQPARTPG